MYPEIGRFWSWDALETLVQKVLIRSWVEGSILLLGGQQVHPREGLQLEAGPQGIDTAASAGRHQVMMLRQKPGRRESPQ